ncbi:hypothetical protein D1872_291830 [compost metagenome]
MPLLPVHIGMKQRDVIQRRSRVAPEQQGGVLRNRRRRVGDAADDRNGLSVRAAYRRRGFRPASTEDRDIARQG